ncbi:MAG: queuosine precursor transporter [Planctomycetota bacterium]
MSNEVIALLSFLFLSVLAVAGGWFGRAYLFCLLVAYVLLSNFTFPLEVDIFGSSISWAIIMYSVSYLILDILIERYSTVDAYKAAFLGLCSQMLLFVYLWLFWPATLAGDSKAVAEYIGAAFADGSGLVTLAALVSSIGWFANIFIYDFMKKKAGGKEGIHIAARNIVSTLVGQLLNTIIIFAIVRPDDVTAPLAFIATAVLFKWIIAFVDTPLLYFATLVIPASTPPAVTDAAPPAPPTDPAPDSGPSDAEPTPA